MDVRCERCQARYVVDDALVKETGLAVRCSKCGYLFRVKREPRGWRLRRHDGGEADIGDMSALQKWIVEGKVASDDEVSREGGPWLRAGDLQDLEPFFTVVAKAQRAPGDGSRAIAADADEPTLEITEESADEWEGPAAGKPAGAEPAWASAEAAGRATRRPDPGPASRRQDRRGSRLTWALAAVTLVLAGGVALYLESPGWFRLDRLPSLDGNGAAPDPGMTSPSPAPHADAPGSTAPAAAPAESQPPTPPPAASAAPEPGVARDPALTPPPAAAAPIQPSPPPAAAPPVEPAPAPAVAPPPSSPTPVPAPTPAPAPAAARAAPTQSPGEEQASVRHEPSPARTLHALLAEARRLRDRGRPEAALDTYARAVQLAPSHPDALAGRGLCYLDLSQYVPAEESFKAALATDGDNAAALMGLAETYRYEGRRAEAVTYYRRYLAVHPQGEDATAARNAISALEESP